MKGYTMQYYVLQKIADDFYSVDKVRKPIATFNDAVAKIKALQTLDDDATTYIITQQVGFDDKR